MCVCVCYYNIVHEVHDRKKREEKETEQMFVCLLTEKCAAVCTCRTFPTAIAVGSDEATQSSGRVQIYEYNEHSRSVMAVSLTEH